jgi:ATP-dependent Lhr-like helicase
MVEGGLLWFGCGERQVAFAYDDLLDLARDGEPSEPATDLVPERGRYAFADLLSSNGCSSAELTEELWSAVWRGEVSNDSFAAVRSGLAAKFKATDVAETVAPSPAQRGGWRTRSRKSGFGRWRSSRPFAGNWYRLPMPDGETDSLDDLERDRDRVRLLLERYGILFKELCNRELPPCRWGRLFRAMRLMELSGEIVAGLFFEGLPGVQFVAADAVSELRREPPADAVYWLNAHDPAAACGLGIEALAELPERRPTNHLVYHADRLVLLSKRGGKDLDILVEPDHERLGDYLALFHEQHDRASRARRGINVETVNGEPAPQSPYLPVLRACFDATVDYQQVKLWRRAQQR